VPAVFQRDFLSLIIMQKLSLIIMQKTVFGKYTFGLLQAI